MKDIFTGKLVRLSAFDPEEMSKAFPRWNLNSEYFRLLNSSARPMQSVKAAAKWMEKEAEEQEPEQRLHEAEDQVHRALQRLPPGSARDGGKHGQERGCFHHAPSFVRRRAPRSEGAARSLPVRVR